MKNSKESGEFEIPMAALTDLVAQNAAAIARPMDRKSPKGLVTKLHLSGTYGKQSEDELELAKREGATRARIDREHVRLMRLVADASVGYLKHGNARGASTLWRDMTSRLADFRERHAALGLILVAFALSTLAGCSGGETTSSPAVDAGSPSIVAAQQAAASHCTHISECSAYNGNTTPENTCEYDETNVLQDRAFTCTEQQLYACQAANRSPYCTTPEDFTIGGACAYCFGDAS